MEVKPSAKILAGICGRPGSRRGRHARPTLSVAASTRTVRKRQRLTRNVTKGYHTPCRPEKDAYVRLHDLNGFIISSIVLFGIAIAGVIKGNRWLSEPGMPVNGHAWMLYFVAAVVMLANGLISIRVARRAEKERAAQRASGSEDKGRQSST